MRYATFSLPDDHPLQPLMGEIWCTADTSNTHLTGIYFEGQRYEPKRSDYLHTPEEILPRKEASGNSRALSQAITWLQAYFSGQQPGCTEMPLFSIGTPFQKAVWHALLEISYGETRTYQQIAQQIGQPKASRAVGAAIGRNPWSILVPCHRVIGQNGSLTGYAGGLDRKSALLCLEQTNSGADR